MQVYVSQSITKNIQYKLTNFYLRQDYNELINQTSSQKRANITVSDSLDNRFFFPLTEIIPKLTIVIILSSISLYLFPKLTVSVLVVIILILGTININIKKKLDETGTQIAKANYKLNGLMFESFQIIKIVIINQAVNFFMKDLKLIHKNLIKYNSFSHAISQIL